MTVEHFRGDLLLGDEDVRVVLGEGAHAHQPVQRAGRLEAVHLAELGDLERQVAIGFQPVLENLDVAGAVHRLDDEGALVLLARLDQEHAVAERRHVAGGDPQRRVDELRRVDFGIAGVRLAAADVVLQRLEQRPALGVPEHRAGRFLLEMEQIHLAAEPAVVALFRFLDLLEIGVELFLLGEGGAVDARQHLAVGIAAPIGAGDLHQLERVADLAGRGHVRAAAEIEPVALLVDLELLVFRDGVDQLDLESLALVAKHLLRLVARPHFLGEGFVAGDDLAHLLFDRVEILRRERLVAEEIVIEAVLDHRPDGDLRAGPQRLHRFGEHVRGVVADEFQRARIVAVEELDLGIVLDRIGEIGELAVERHRHGALGERRRNALGDIEAGGVLRVFPTRAVGKGHGDHFLAPFAHSLPTNAGKRDGRYLAHRTSKARYAAVQHDPCNAFGCCARRLCLCVSSRGTTGVQRSSRRATDVVWCLTNFWSPQ